MAPLMRPQVINSVTAAANTTIVLWAGFQPERAPAGHAETMFIHTNVYRAGRAQSARWSTRCHRD